MSAPKAEAVGLTVEPQRASTLQGLPAGEESVMQELNLSELRRVAEAAGESNEGGWLVARGLREAVSRGGEVLERAEAAHIETFGPERVLALLDALAAAEAIRDEARAAVERGHALADVFKGAGTVCVYESAAEIGQIIHAALDGEGA
jgi:hypothetical protein